jgi:carbonic anhydrase
VLLKAGSANPVVETLWQNLPAKKETEVVKSDVSIDAADLLPKGRGYYTFTGSLTTPPCSEGVTWFVMKEPSPISAQQVARFGKLYPMNARPVQPLHGRTVAVGP